MAKKNRVGSETLSPCSPTEGDSSAPSFNSGERRYKNTDSEDSEERREAVRRRTTKQARYELVAQKYTVRLHP